MTDSRGCDGPQCTVVVSLDNEISSFAEMRAEQFITVSRPHGQSDLHFHNGRCMLNWTMEVTRASER